MKNRTVFYISALLIFGVALWVVLLQGQHLELDQAQVASVADSSAANAPHFFSNLERNARHPLAVLIIQIFCIMIVARVFGYFMTRIGQPSVIGEIIAGIALGPSLLGFVFPEFSAFLFPVESLRRLQVLSQIGLVFFMFIIGMELDVGVIRKKARDAVLISHSSIVLSYFLGVIVAYFLYSTYAPPHVSFVAFALFVGIAMSVMAFPVLARIIQERNLTHTPIGTLVITCAAIDDLTAWCLLALVVAVVGASGLLGAMGSIVLAIGYLLFMWFAVRPLLRRLAVKYDTPESINQAVVAAVFGILLCSSYATEVIGIHALFGAFVAGVIMPPHPEFKRIFSEKIEDVSLVVLLPLFFVFTGLRTELGLLSQAHLWDVCALIIGVAVAGKFAGSALAAKFVGHSWKDSLLIGTLMNTRGLMELVVLNIGYDLGVLSAEIFTMLVLMALATTFMTGPVLYAIEFFFKSGATPPERVAQGKFHLLLPFGSPRAGSRLLELAHELNLGNRQQVQVTAVHFSPSADISLVEAEQHERDAFMAIEHTAEQRGIALQKIFAVTNNVERELLATVRMYPHNMILVGSSRELFRDEKTGGKVGSLLHETESPVGVLIDRGFQKITNALFVLDTPQDLALLVYARQFLEGHENNRVTLGDPGHLLAKPEYAAVLAATGPADRRPIVDLALKREKGFYAQHDLVVVSFDFWSYLKRQQSPWLSQMPSVLIVQHRQP